jgi:hypothetical protein
VWAPFGASPGSARLTVSYPGLDREVLPVTAEVPVEEAGWRGWAMTFGPWGLGAVLAAGLVWLAARRRARPGPPKEVRMKGTEA